MTEQEEIEKDLFEKMLTDLAMIKVRYKFNTPKHKALFEQTNALIEKIIYFATEKLK